MLRKKRSSISLAAKFVAQRIQSGAWGMGDRLPTITQLADQAGASPATMWKAIRLLRRQGLISGATVKRTIVLDDAQNEHGATASARIARELQSFLLDNTCPPGSLLPSQKELCGRFGANPRTVRRAISSLAQKKLIEPSGRLYRVVVPFVKKTWMRIAVFAEQPELSQLPHESRDFEFLRALERLCAQSSLGLAVYAVSYENEEIAIRPWGESQRINYADDDSVMGNIWLVNNHAINNRGMLSRFLHQKKPLSVALFAEPGPGMAQTLGNKSCKAFTIGITPRCGVEMGRYLIEMGHRRIAFISPYGETSWSQQRFRGLLQAFSDAGLSPEILPFCSQADELAAPEPSEKSIDALGALLQKAIGELERPFDREIGRLINPQILRNGLWTGRAAFRLQPLFGQALADRGISAWVAANDITALMAIDFLNEHHTSVPHDISVVGFDDLPGSAGYRLTTWNFNRPAMAGAMFSHAIGRNLPLFSQSRRIIEIDGFIVRRGSVAAKEAVKQQPDPPSSSNSISPSVDIMPGK